MRQWVDVATLVKTKSLKGRFVAQSATGLSLLLKEGMRVAFVPPVLDVPREGTIVYVQAINKTLWEIEFDSVADQAIAHELLGCHCLMRRNDVSMCETGNEPLYWIDWRVVDENGVLLGVIVDSVANPAHQLLSVERPQGVGRFLIPVVDEFILSVNEKRRELVVSLPHGLVDL